METLNQVIGTFQCPLRSIEDSLRFNQIFYFKASVNGQIKNTHHISAYLPRYFKCTLKCQNASTVESMLAIGLRSWSHKSDRPTHTALMVQICWGFDHTTLLTADVISCISKKNNTANLRQRFSVQCNWYIGHHLLAYVLYMCVRKLYPHKHNVYPVFYV